MPDGHGRDEALAEVRLALGAAASNLRESLR